MMGADAAASIIQKLFAAVGRHCRVGDGRGAPLPGIGGRAPARIDMPPAALASPLAESGAPFLGLVANVAPRNMPAAMTSRNK